MERPDMAKTRGLAAFRPLSLPSAAEHVRACWLSRCAGRATVAESPHGQGRTPSTEAHWAPLRAAAKR
eukprot:5886025-Alexandrium_andersonii.AAC.1